MLRNMHTAEAGRINRMLSDINASLNTIYHEMQRRDNYVTAEKVKNEFLGHSENHETILTLFQKHNEDVKQLVGISKTIAIIRKSKFPQNPKRSVRFSGKGTKRSVQKRKARNTQKAETKVL